MFTIVMNSDKSLSKRGEAIIRQGERLVDQLKILVPKVYGELDLSEFSVDLTYIDPGNIPRKDRLTLSDPDYKGQMLCYRVPITSSLTKFSGNIVVHLLLTKDKTHLMHSGEAVITVEATNPCYHEGDISPDDSGEGYDVGWQEGYEVGYQAGLAAGGSGGEGVKTCTVRFNRSMWSFVDPELCFLAYTAFVNGKIENVILGEYSGGGGDPFVTLTADDNSVVFENVLCGTQMSFVFNDRGNGYEVTVDENVIRNLNDDAMYGIWAISPDATDVVLEIQAMN